MTITKRYIIENLLIEVITSLVLYPLINVIIGNKVYVIKNNISFCLIKNIFLYFTLANLIDLLNVLCVAVSYAFSINKEVIASEPATVLSLKKLTFSFSSFSASV